MDTLKSKDSGYSAVPLSICWHNCQLMLNFLLHRRQFYSP